MNEEPRATSNPDKCPQCGDEMHTDLLHGECYCCGYLFDSKEPQENPSPREG